MMQLDLEKGKYTVTLDPTNGTLRVLRNGEPWARDLAGDKLVLALVTRTLELQQQRDALESVARNVASQELHTYPTKIPCRCSQCSTVRQAQAALDLVKASG